MRDRVKHLTRVGGPTNRQARKQRVVQPVVPRSWTPEKTFATYIEGLLRWRALVALTILVSLLGGLVYLKFAPAQFTSTALVLVDERSNAPLQLSRVLDDPTSVSANIESQVEILRSPRTMKLVIEDQKLADDPALQPDALSRAMSQLVHRLTGWMRDAPPVSLPERELVAASQALRKRVDVHRLGTTFLIEVSATMSDPTQAALVANSVVRSYVLDQQRRREDLARQHSELLQARSNELEERVRSAEEAVEQLKYSGSLSGENSAAAQVKLKDLQSLAQTYRVLHDKFLEQSAESWQQQFLSVPDATVASAATPPLEKTSPRALLVLAIAFLIGISLASLLVLVLEGSALGLQRQRRFA